MDLLREVRDQALDPNYEAVTRREDAAGSRARRSWVAGTLAVLLVAGLAVGTAWRTTAAQEPALAAERGDLVRRVQSAQAHASAQESQISSLRSQVEQLRRADSAPPTPQAGAVAGVGAAAVSGPGVVLVVDDARDAASDAEGRIGDADLRRVVNGLWQAGAEAVAINGRRVSARTAIRTAGSAITVDYVSLSRPYTIEAIGDPATLPGRFAQTDGAVQTQFLHDNYGVRYEIHSRTRIDLPASGNLTVAEATPR